MPTATGRLIEIWSDGSTVVGRIACPAELLPAPGQYLQASPEEDALTPLATALFTARLAQENTLIAAPIPPSWMPGTRLRLRGPLGRGFSLPISARRVALATIAESPALLLPLASQALRQECAVTLYANFSPGATLPILPSAIEINPLDDLPGALAWADFLAIEAPLARLESLPDLLGVQAGAPLPYTAQVLVRTDMPCGGLADCGVCAVRTRRGWRLACKDGPVFDLHDLAFNQ